MGELMVGNEISKFDSRLKQFKTVDVYEVGLISIIKQCLNYLLIVFQSV